LCYDVSQSLYCLKDNYLAKKEKEKKRKKENTKVNEVGFHNNEGKTIIAD